MIQARVLWILVVGLVAALQLTGAQIDEHHEPQQAMSGPAAVLENLNSLDFAAGDNHDQQQKQQQTQRPVVASANEERATNATRKGRSRRLKPHAAATASQANSLGGLLVNLLGQLERVDFGRVLSDLSSPQKSSARGTAAAAGADQIADRSAASPTSKQNSTSSEHFQGNAQQQQQLRNGKVNVSALSAETGNLLSITKQLVKLARNQVLGTDYFGSGPAYPSGAGAWASPFMMPASSMLSAASHALHDSLDAGHTGATLKSEWLWWLAPAVIVIGSGVIVIPLIAAYLISQAMSQNSFTVSAGRRRRRRRRSVAAGEGGKVANSHHFDLMRLLDVHRLLDDAPELLVEQLSRFHDALDHVGAQFLAPSLTSETRTAEAKAATMRRRHQHQQQQQREKEN